MMTPAPCRRRRILRRYSVISRSKVSARKVRQAGKAPQRLRVVQTIPEGDLTGGQVMIGNAIDNGKAVSGG